MEDTALWIVRCLIVKDKGLVLISKKMFVHNEGESGNMVDSNDDKVVDSIPSDEIQAMKEYCQGAITAVQESAGMDARLHLNGSESPFCTMFQANSRH